MRGGFEKRKEKRKKERKKRPFYSIHRCRSCSTHAHKIHFPTANKIFHCHLDVLKLRDSSTITYLITLSFSLKFYAVHFCELLSTNHTTLHHAPSHSMPDYQQCFKHKLFLSVFTSMLTKGFPRLHSKRFVILKCEPINILYSFDNILKISTYKKVKVHCTNIYATTTMVHSVTK